MSRKKRVVLGEKGGETVETKTDTSSSVQPEELWCWVQKRDETKSRHLLLPPPTFPKEKEKKEEEEGEGEEGERGEERSKWKPDARCTVALFGLGAVGTMMSQTCRLFINFTVCVSALLLFCRLLEICLISRKHINIIPRSGQASVFR